MSTDHHELPLSPDDLQRLLLDAARQRVAQRTEDNLQLVAAALTDPRRTMPARRQQAEELAREAMRKLRSSRPEA